jgi:hypothetical protein
MTPSVGRIVHYVSRGSADGIYKPECRAAIITQVNYDQTDGLEGYVGLAVWNPSGMFFHEAVDYAAGQNVLDPELKIGKTHVEYIPGTWHWPERVE